MMIGSSFPYHQQICSVGPLWCKDSPAERVVWRWLEGRQKKQQYFQFWSLVFVKSANIIQSVYHKAACQFFHCEEKIIIIKKK